MRTFLALSALAACVSLAAPAMAQPAPPPPSRAASAPAAPPPPPPIAYRTVAEALKDLEAKDGNGTIVTHPDGWTVVTEPMASAQWSFTPKDHEAYPAVVRRIVTRSREAGVSVDTASLCEAPKAACEKLMAEFAVMSERLTQGAKARARQGSTPPAMR